MKVILEKPQPSLTKLLATEVKAETDDPVYAARSVLKVLPFVLMVTLETPDGAVHRHHTDLPPLFPACTGSLVSLIASMLFPVAVMLVFPEGITKL